MLWWSEKSRFFRNIFIERDKSKTDFSQWRLTSLETNKRDATNDHHKDKFNAKVRGVIQAMPKTMTKNSIETIDVYAGHMNFWNALMSYMMECTEKHFVPIVTVGGKMQEATWTCKDVSQSQTNATFNLHFTLTLNGKKCKNNLQCSSQSLAKQTRSSISIRSQWRKR